MIYKTIATFILSSLLLMCACGGGGETSKAETPRATAPGTGQTAIPPENTRTNTPTPKRVGSLEDIVKDVKVNGQMGRKKQDVRAKDVIKTGEEASQAIVKLDDGSTCTILARSQVTLRPEEGKRASFDSGKTYCTTGPGNANEDFAVGQSFLQVSQPTTFVVSTSATGTTVQVVEGRVGVTSRGTTVITNAKSETLVPISQPPQAPKISAPLTGKDILIIENQQRRKLQ